MKQETISELLDMYKNEEQYTIHIREGLSFEEKMSGTNIPLLLQKERLLVMKDVFDIISSLENISIET